jgi:hypothetical protein
MASEPVASTAATSELPRNLEGLPYEILGNCIEYLEHSKEDIQNLRLVSKRCNAVSSPFLLDSIRVCVTSSSLFIFETLSQHPVFSKSIRNVKIDVSYYDAKLAEDRGLFGRHCGSNLYRRLECYERSTSFTEEEEDPTQRLWPVSDEWERVDTQAAHLEETCTETERLLLDAHSHYNQLYLDQEQVKQDGAHIQRICVALERFSNLMSITIDDSPYYSPRAWPGDFSDEELLEDCLRPSAWQGSFITAPLTSPPVEIIPELFQALGKTSVRPTKFRILISPPFNLRSMQLSEPACQAIQTVISQSRHLVCKVGTWARKDSLAEDNSRPREEMVALCSLTAAFFNAPNLTTMEVVFDGYPAFYETPQVSLVDILPLSENSWPHLRVLSLRYAPCRMEELGVLVKALRKLKSLEITAAWLLSGTWTNSLDILRGFEGLQNVCFKYPHSGDWSDRGMFVGGVLEEEIRQYVLGLRERNPLRGLNLKED